ncbi:FAD-binding oxidoreductase [Herbiconiux sp. A18JL235]|uniref:FAD-binding oxidoreductase n=1 Tax=Herbiconiux sp. A18JL235 TaxID=3152363 RepID=A0AB39BLA8_9MICO
MTPAELLGALRAELGDRVTTDAATLEQVRSDKSGWRSEEGALCVVTAESVADVQTAVRLAASEGVAIVPRGTGTGLAGGATSTEGSVVLALDRLDRIVEISLDDELAVVQAGVINQHLSDALLPHGYVYSPDPASKAISTIGGNIATNAGGLLCAKYGVTREAVLGLTVVLADGSLLHTGRRTVKGVTGYDLTALFTGSEGTLGVIVEATVRIRPLPAGPVVTLGAFFGSVTEAAAACAAVTAARLRPAVMELMDAAAVAAVNRLLGRPSAAAGAAYVLVQTDGAGAEIEAAEIATVLGAAGALGLRSTADAAEGEAELAFRRSFHAALEADGDVLVEDVCVPRSRLAEMFAAIERIGAAYGLSIPTVSHAGDGNLHPNFVIPREGAARPSGAPLEVPDHVWAAADELFETCVALGGTLTGEHGVGLLKKRWLEGELGAEQLELQKRVKAVFDPRGVMNPGKVY